MSLHTELEVLFCSFRCYKYAAPSAVAEAMADKTVLGAGGRATCEHWQPVATTKGHECAALTGLGESFDRKPRALPWAIIYRAFSPSSMRRRIVRVGVPSPDAALGDGDIAKPVDGRLLIVDGGKDMSQKSGKRCEPHWQTVKSGNVMRDKLERADG